MSGRVLALSGGVGGAKLAFGLARVLDAGQLTIIANTGDDFRHLGLAISPDLDTLMYTLAGLADPIRGWGRRDETWNCLEALEQLGGDTWFRLGDRDLALHLERTRLLAARQSLSTITDNLRRRLGITAEIAPMTDDPVRTKVRTDEGWLDFQDYFVRRRCEPAIREIAYEGAAIAHPSAALQRGLADRTLRAIALCPSNPLLSIEPILSLPGVRSALAARTVPVLAVSPLIGGQAVKGPTAKILRELNLAVSNATIAARYAGLIDALIVDEADAELPAPAGMQLLTAPILMNSDADRERLAAAVLTAADRLR